MRYFKWTIAILLLILPLIACYPAQTTAAPETSGISVKGLSDKLNSLVEEVAKLKKDYVNDVDTLNKRISNITIPQSTGGVSQATFDALQSAFNTLKSDYTTSVTNLNSKITALETKVNSGSGTGTGTGSGTTTTGGGINVTFNPQPQPTWGGTSSQVFNYYMTLQNTGTVGKYVKLQALFTSLNGQPVNIATAGTSLEVSYPQTIPMTPVYSPSAAACTMITGVWTGTPFFIPSGQSATVVAKFTILHTSGSTMWQPTFTPIASDQPY